MPSFFSGTDDKYELGDPGIHLVVGDVKVKEMKYTIAASVVGSGRRFEMNYSNLIDATPVAEVTFHPKVTDYVDYTSPLTTTTYASGITYNSWSKKVSTATDGDTNDYQKWLNNTHCDDFSGDVSDPYHYSEGNYNYTPIRTRLKLWEIEELIKDYVTVHQHDINSLCNFADSLKDHLKEIEDHVGFCIDAIYT